MAQPVIDPPSHSRPAFLITIDTEGDNAWQRARTVTTQNALHLPRFQELCDRYGLKPTYLVTWEMAHSLPLRELVSEAIRDDRAEVGMHLHAWNSPPLHPLTPDDDRYHPYLIEYPDHIMRAKVQRLAAAVRETFDTDVVSHRAGRWAFDERYARILVESGYRVDCSVTPYVSWRSTTGAPQGTGGSDYRGFPDGAYWIDPEDVGRPGRSDLLEVPVTIRPPGHTWMDALRPLLARVRGVRRFLPRPTWLRPTGRNLGAMTALLRGALAAGSDYVEFMLHSSELMPGCSPSFSTPDSIEALYHDLEALFEEAACRFDGQTLAEFYVRHRRNQNAPACP